MIKRWIERIPEAIKQIIALDGENEYMESTRRRKHLQKNASTDARADGGAEAGDDTESDSNIPSAGGSGTDRDEEGEETEPDDYWSIINDSETDSEEDELDIDENGIDG
jgi:hypothetical protein